MISCKYRIYALIIFTCSSLFAFSQKDSSVVQHASVKPDFIVSGKDKNETQKIKNDQPETRAILSKSEKTTQPTIIKIKRGELKNVTTIQHLIQAIPATCTISTCQIAYKISENVFFLSNVGSELDPLLLQKLEACTWVIIENINSSCPKLHKANYKIMMQ